MESNYVVFMITQFYLQNNIPVDNGEEPEHNDIRR